MERSEVDGNGSEVVYVNGVDAEGQKVGEGTVTLAGINHGSGTRNKNEMRGEESVLED